MKLVLLTTEQVGQTLAMPIFNNNGLIFLNRGKVLTEKIIHQIQKIGITAIYVETPYATISLEEMLPSSVRNSLIKDTNILFKDILKSQTINEFRVVSIVDSILKNISISENSILINNIAAEDNFARSCISAIDQVIYAVLFGLAKGYTSHKLKELAIAAFLHNLNGPNTELTRNMIRHSTNFPATISTSILTSYEAINGSGPLGKKGDDIYEYAKILRIIRDYVALINDNKLPHEAIEILFTGSGTLYDMDFINLFTKNIYCYPNGLPIILNDGREGIVVKQNKSLPTRPIVLVNKTNIVNLQQDLTFFIEEIAL